MGLHTATATAITAAPPPMPPPPPPAPCSPSRRRALHPDRLPHRRHRSHRHRRRHRHHYRPPAANTATLHHLHLPTAHPATRPTLLHHRHHPDYDCHTAIGSASDTEQLVNAAQSATTNTGQNASITVTSSFPIDLPPRRRRGRPQRINCSSSSARALLDARSCRCSRRRTSDGHSVALNDGGDYGTVIETLSGHLQVDEP